MMTDATRARDPDDPKGLIREAYRIDGITDAECRSILVDWALSLEAADPRPAIERLLARHCGGAEDHPMTLVLREGLTQAPSARRRGGRAARVSDG
jgi:hypothetical protein